MDGSGCWDQGPIPCQDDDDTIVETDEVSTYNFG